MWFICGAALGLGLEFSTGLLLVTGLSLANGFSQFKSSSNWALAP